MSEQTQFQPVQQLTPEELENFKSVQSEYQKAIFDLGVLSLSIDEAQSRISELVENKSKLTSYIDEVNTKRITLTTELGEKYGDKQVDLETGELK
jgi:predicted transcriptional regulator